MKIIRWFLGKLILAGEKWFPPAQLELSSEERERRKNTLQGICLYEFLACPFCVKVRRYLQSQGVELPRVNAQIEPGRSELLRGGGKVQVPCLKITEPSGEIRWLYESKDIVVFLGQRMKIEIR